jgi:hypothetical protein
VFAAADEDALDQLAAGRLNRFELLTLMRAGVLRAARLELRPTFRRPHYTVMLPDPEPDIERLLECDHEVRENRYYVERRGERP